MNLSFLYLVMIQILMKTLMDLTLILENLHQVKLIKCSFILHQK